MTDQNPTSPDQGSGEGYQPPATPGGYQPPATPGGYQQPATGGYQPPAGGYEPPAGGYQPPAGGYAEPSGPVPGQQYPPAGGYSQPPAPGYPAPAPLPFSGPGGAKLAEWPIRALGGLVDYVAPSVIIGVVSSVIINNVSYSLGYLLQVVLSIGWWIYLAYLSGTYGITPGRAIAKTKLIGEQSGTVIGFGQAILRQFAHLIDSIICYIGWLFPLWDSKKQTIADKIAKTVVVDNSADPSAGQIRWS